MACSSLATFAVVGSFLNQSLCLGIGWSTWNTFRYNVTDVLLRQMAQAMVDSGLADAGYEYILIDDGWSECAVFNSDGGCAVQAARDNAGRIPPDPIKVCEAEHHFVRSTFVPFLLIGVVRYTNQFPNGMKPVADFMHSLGLKLGIYTAVSNATCGGFLSSLGHEAVDAQTFADWGMDFVKHDTCNSDCGIRDGCIQQSTARMRDALNATGRPIVYYIDDGNDRFVSSASTNEAIACISHALRCVALRCAWRGRV